MILNTTLDLKRAVLDRASEQSDGTSPYDSRALQYLNEAYQGVISGGSEWGRDISDAWIWAQRKQPIVLVIEPEQTGNVDVVQGQDEITFSQAPPGSLEGFFFKPDNRETYYRIVQHTAGETSAQLDSEYVEETGTLGFRAMKLEYELADNRIIINNRNNRLDFNEGGANLSVTVTNGSYTPAGFATELQTQLNATGTQTYTVSYNEVTRKFRFATDGTSLTFLFNSGENSSSSLVDILGLDMVDLDMVTQPTSIYPLNAINRLIAPATMYRVREGDAFYQAEVDQGKISGISMDTMEELYPLTNMMEGMPERFAIVEERDNGTLVLRFNRYPKQASRVEFRYIPEHRALQDNDSSIPVVPKPYRTFLVYAATQLLMQDKSDSRAQDNFALAQQKLLAMRNDYRAESQQTGKNYGRLIPRRDRIKTRRLFIR